MQLRKRLLSLLLLTAILLPCLCIAPLPLVSAEPAAAGGEARFTKKIVSVLYDNSHSMSNSDPTNPGDDRQYYAEYSMRMLMALLSPNDQLIITPMNKTNGSAIDSLDHSVIVDLQNPDREGEIERVMNNRLFSPTGGTPGDSIYYAVEHLKALGLKDKQNLASAEENVEHWLIVMTDGAMKSDMFDIVVNPNTTEKLQKENTSRILEGFIKDYPSLKTVYMTFGAGVSLEGCLTGYPFTPYKAGNATQVTQVMQNIANQISGRYPYPATDYTVSGNKVTIDLDKAKCTLKSISVVAQNCGVKLDSVTYQGKPLQTALPCVIQPDVKLKMQNGYTAKIEGTPYFSEGKLVLTFSGVVPKEKLSILAEPALEIRPYFEYENNGRWERVTAQFVNEKLTVDSKLRANYEVFELANGKPITNINDIFGNHTATVTYAQKTYDVGQTLSLQVGINPVTISVSLMDGAYKMSASVLCAIEKDPSAYKIDAAYKTMVSHKESSTEAIYTIFVDGDEASRETLSNYSWTAKVTDPNGATADATTTIDANGRIHATILPKKNLYGDYTVKFKIISPEGFSREHTYVFTYTSLAISIEKNGPDSIPTGSTKADVNFWVLLDGNKLSKAQLEEFDFSVSATAPDGKSATVTPTVATDGTVKCALDVGTGSFGIYTVKFTVKSDGGETREATHRIAFHPASFELKAEHIDKMPAGQTKTTFTYSVLMNGTPLTKAQIEQYEYLFTLLGPTGEPIECNPTLGADGKITVPLDLAETGYGEYKATFTFTVDESCSREDVHTLKNYPESLAIIPVSGNSFSMSEHQFTTGAKPLEFNLLLNGSPAPFDTRGVHYKLMAGGTDVTADATVDGNRIIYLPKSEDFGFGSLQGQKQIVLSVDFDGVPSLSRSETVTITITDTTYLVEVVPSGKYDVDRFALNETDAVLYFRVMRDGMPLTAEELRAALDSGAIKVQDNSGAFTWQFWLPTGERIEPLTRGGETLLAVSATRDWIRPFDSFAAMFIFNGDKPISVTYGGASATDSFRFAPSPAWEYIWRVLVILLVIHIILYVIGFFNGKCRSLPSGYFVKFKIGVVPGGPCKASTVPINTTFWDKYSWHIWRFFPHKKTLWYHQPPRKLPESDLLLMLDPKNARPVFLFKSAKWYSCTKKAGIKPGSNLVDNFVISLRLPGKKQVKLSKEVTNEQATKIFILPKKTQAFPTDTMQSAGAYYVKLNKKGNLNAVVTFVPKLK